MRIGSGTLVIAMGWALVALSAQAMPIPEPEIVGGSAAAQRDHPFLVSLQSEAGHFCAGSIINSSTILTAGHCLSSRSAQDLRVLADCEGVRRLHPGKPCRFFAASSIAIHPDFSNRRNLSYDIAVLKIANGPLPSPIQMTNASPEASPNNTHYFATAYGWGDINEDEDHSSGLMQVQLPLVSRAVCELAFPSLLDESMLCAGYADGGRDACKGDSGGPLTTRNSRGEEVLTGVISWGDGCARKNKFGVYAAVASARAWIESVMGQVP